MYFDLHSILQAYLVLSASMIVEGSECSVCVRRVHVDVCVFCSDSICSSPASAEECSGGKDDLP